MSSDTNSTQSFRITETDIFRGFPNQTSNSQSRTKQGITKCFEYLALYIKETVATNSICNPYEREMFFMSFNTKKAQRAERFCDSLLQSKDLSKMILEHLLENFDMTAFEKGLQRVFEYHYLCTEMDSLVQDDDSKKRLKV